MDNTEENIVILKDSFRYSLSTYLLVVFGIITAFATRRILGPVLMGTFTQLMIIFQYSKYHHIGVFSALERELPYYNGKRDSAKVAQLKNIGFSSTTITSLSVAFGITAASFLLKLDPNMLAGMRLLAVALIIQSVVSFLTVLVKTHHKFTFLSKYNIYTAVLQAALTIYLGLKFGLSGILWVSIIIGLVGVFYLMEAKFEFKFIFPFSLSEVLGLLKIGTPLLMNDIALASLMNMDKFSIIKYFGKTELGYYSIAIMVANYLYLLPNLIYAVLYPRFYESFGKAGDIKKLRHYLETPTTIISYFIAGIIGCMILALPFLVKYILPNYAPGIMPANILLFGMFFMSLQGMSTYLLVVMNKQKQMILLSLFGIALATFFNHIFIKVLHWDINGVAAAMLVTYFIYSATFIGYAFRYHTKKVSHMLEFFVKIYTPFLWLAVVVYLLSLISPHKNLTFKMDCVNLFMRFSIFALAYIPLMYYLNKKTHIMDKIFKIVKFPFIAKG